MSLIDKASLIQIPSGYKSTKLYSIEPTNGDGDFTFARSSSATRVNSEGLIEVASVLGSELVTNGDFATDSDWSSTEVATIGISGGSINFSSTSSNKRIQNIGSIIVGKKYIVNYDIVSISEGSFAFQDGVSTYTYRSSIGSYSEEITASGTFIRIRTAGTTTGSIDNVSVKEVIENDVPRLDYSGGASCASLLLEPQRTNLYLNSEPSANEGPAGNISYVGTSFGLGFNNYTYYLDNSVVRYRYGGTCAATTEYTLSVFVIMDDNSSPNVSTSSTSGDFSLVIADGFATPISVTHYGNNIYRVIAKRTSGTSGLSNNGIVKYTEQSSVGFKAVGWQLEAGSYATSYIPTSGSTVTRTADVCNNAGTSATFNSTEGVLFAEIAALYDDGTYRQISLTESSGGGDVLTLDYSSTSNQIRSFIRVNGAAQSLTHTLTDETQYNKIAIKYKDTHEIWVNGSKVASSSLTLLPIDINLLTFDNGAGGGDFYGKTKQLMVFNEALSDEELSDLTGQVNLSFNNLATFYNYTIL